VNRIRITIVEGILRKHAQGPAPECELIAHMLCQAAKDAVLPEAPTRNSADDADYITLRKQAIMFFRSHYLTFWAQVLELRPEMVRELFIQAGYLQPEPPKRKTKYPLFDAAAFAQRRAKEEREMKARRKAREDK